MRLIEISCAAVVLVLFWSLAAGAEKPLRRLHADTQRISHAHERDRFIANGFTSLCASDGRDQFSDWQRMCESLWKLEAFSIETIGTDSEQNDVFSCTWKTADGTQTVLAIYKKGVQ